jgi:hypothetical protein
MVPYFLVQIEQSAFSVEIETEVRRDAMSGLGGGGGAIPFVSHQGCKGRCQYGVEGKAADGEVSAPE